MGRITSIIVYFDAFPIVRAQVFCYFFFIFKAFSVATVVSTGYSVLDQIPGPKKLVSPLCVCL